LTRIKILPLDNCMSQRKSEDKEVLVFAPGCALMLYKPELAEKIHQKLQEKLGKMEMLLTCCQHDPQLSPNTKIINVCPGCDKRFRNDYWNITTVSLWEILAQKDFLELPDYSKEQMSIIDACPTRDQVEILNAIRTVISKMNIMLIEPKNTKAKGTCCGDSYHGIIPTEEVVDLMKQRTAEMPVDEVVVYCISCVKAVFNGGKNPRYLIDLVFEEDTIPMTIYPDDWHSELREYINLH
jgi:Fe-S oxidoreductase